MKKRILLSLLGLLCTMQLFAQNGSISGKVLDNKKQPVPDAIVIAIQNGSPKGGTTSDKMGVYTIKNLPPGNYDVKARGFYHRARISTYIAVRTDAVTPLDFELYPKDDKTDNSIQIQKPH